ncbi:hypothetical protein B0H11DRAFT_657076 [Mycena galericulata]|nr:hypothetical protein B0H11DRAFT_657076 [Mycena galericulata]
MRVLASFHLFARSSFSKFSTLQPCTVLFRLHRSASACVRVHPVAPPHLPLRGRPVPRSPILTSSQMCIVLPGVLCARAPHAVFLHLSCRCCSPRTSIYSFRVQNNDPHVNEHRGRDGLGSASCSVHAYFKFALLRVVFCTVMRWNVIEYFLCCV